MKEAIFHDFEWKNFASKILRKIIRVKKNWIKVGWQILMHTEGFYIVYNWGIKNIFIWIKMISNGPKNDRFCFGFLYYQKIWTLKLRFCYFKNVTIFSVRPYNFLLEISFVLSSASTPFLMALRIKGICLIW